MTLYAITYDLNKTKNYQKLWDEFDRLGAQKAANSFYFVNLRESKVEVFNHFLKFIDDDDRLIVVPFTAKPAYRNAKKGTNAWFAENLVS